MSQAEAIMRQNNPNALVGIEGDEVIIIEDVSDPDGRLYRLEYQCTPDARKAVAICLSNPWGGVNAGTSYWETHVDDEGFICVGSSSIKHLENSPYDLEYVVARARYWCTAFSVFMEQGEFPEP